MINELNKEDYLNVLPLLANGNINLEITSVVKGYNPGWIFVDDVDAPKTALVWSKGICGFYFVGDPSNDAFNDAINAYIDDVIKVRAIELGLTSFEFSGTSVAWDKQLKVIFKNRKMDLSTQYVYDQVHEHVQTKEINLPQDYEMAKVDRKLLMDSSLDLKMLKDTILEWWDSLDDYLQYGSGFCILNQDESVCSCVTSFYDDHESESHIVTAEAHRYLGLASQAVQAYINYAKDNGFNLYWDCMQTNAGSIKLAEKSGYSRRLEYQLFEFDF